MTEFWRVLYAHLPNAKLFKTFATLGNACKTSYVCCVSAATRADGSALGGQPEYRGGRGLDQDCTDARQAGPQTRQRQCKYMNQRTFFLDQTSIYAIHFLPPFHSFSFSFSFFLSCWWSPNSVPQSQLLLNTICMKGEARS